MADYHQTSKQTNQRGRRKSVTQLSKPENEIQLVQSPTVEVLIQRASVPSALSPHDVLHLQRTIGNRAVGQLLGRNRESARYTAGTKPVIQRKPISWTPTPPPTSAGPLVQPSTEPAFAKLLQRLKGTTGYGNNTPPIQRDGLRVGSANDKYEQEADETADEIMRMPSVDSRQPSVVSHQMTDEGLQTARVVQRQGEDDEERLQLKRLDTVQRDHLEDDEETLMTKRLDTVQREGGDGSFETDTAFTSRLNSSKGGGRPLPTDIQADFGSKMGADFSGVRVHTDNQAAQMSHQIQAKAFTHGSDIYMGAGQYNPSSSEGKRLLAHEATHTIQQGAVQRLSRSPLVSPGKPNQSNVIQRKGEFKALHNQDENQATALVQLDYTNYASYQKQFERQLGIGLHSNVKALQGADAMLTKMKAAMRAAGFNDSRIKKAFAMRKGKSDLGGVLEDDVEQALSSGNLREKMGMVYQARMRLCDALVELREMVSPGFEIGDEMKSHQMGVDIENLRRENEEKRRRDEKVSAISYAVLKRRPSVRGQRRDKVPNREKRKLITGELLSEWGIPLSEREKRAVDPDETHDRRYIPGSEYYRVPPDLLDTFHNKLIHMVSGLSGSTDMYFNMASHLKMNLSQRKLLRLAALGQMIANNDHSYHEIMHVAKTQGGLDDYPDELPLGYTTLAPLSENEILTTAGLDDFPGDQQVKQPKISSKATIIQRAGKAFYNTLYSKVLSKVDEYNRNPQKTTLQQVITKIDDWTEAKKPGPKAWKITKTNWQNSTKRQTLANLKDEANRALRLYN